MAKCKSRFLATVLVNTKTRFSSEVRKYAIVVGHLYLGIVMLNISRT